MNFLARQWFLIALATVVATGLLAAPMLSALADVAWLKWLIVALTMFLMAWPLKLTQFTDRISAPAPPLTATALNTLLAPLLLWPLAICMPEDIAQSMILAFAAPCTLASAAVWTARAGGDDSVAIMVTIITSCLCFVTTPAIIYLLIGQSVSPHVLTSLIWKLLICIVLPIGFAQSVRIHRASAAWATKHKTWANTAAQCGILAIVLIGSIASGRKMKNFANAGHVGMIVVAVILMLIVHAVILFAAARIAKAMGMNRAEQIAVAFSGSQKTLMVALAVSSSLGVTVIPLVAYHSLQLLIDTLIADFAFRPDPT